MVTKATSKTSKKQVKKTAGKPAAKKTVAQKDLVLVTKTMSNQFSDLYRMTGAHIEKKMFDKVIKSALLGRNRALKFESKELAGALAAKKVLQQFLKKYAAKVEKLFAPVKTVQYWDDMDVIIDAKRVATRSLSETSAWIKQLERDVADTKAGIAKIEAIIAKEKSQK